MWVREWIAKREEEGVYAKLLKELEYQDVSSYENFIRMTHQDFQHLLERIAPRIRKQDTHLRKSISPSERLTLTLRFLATGDSYQSLSYLFRIPPTTISRIVPEVCDALYLELKNDYLKIPCTSEEWENEAKRFDATWNFPNCIGAIDGKHVVMKAPEDSGSLYYNYKGTLSIVLMALVNADYKFLYIEVGCNGRVSDGGVYANCSLSACLENKSLNIPEAKPLRFQSVPVPYVIVADDAFPLKTYIMKPFPFRDQPVENRVFNYRLSRARRVVENAFGLLSMRFRFLRKPVELCPQKVIKLVQAACVLHNYLIEKKSTKYVSEGTVDMEKNGRLIEGCWRDDPLPQNSFYSLQHTGARNPTCTAKQVRENFRTYFMSRAGELPWQYKYV
ncbi:protein ANTAGONIST OF LIKE HETEROCHROMATIN PROTEIN 1-like [Ctenocephalides felis]|uniref:protein ANTAGONIST OF LIKE HETEROCHROMATIN PROTEIN 1-like n=1 Tax=Ctenocephalides felis TaxID=7515 RepID=UPI000E6E473E|nr:protein ANTAGONIST OF LIKE HETEROCHROMATIN PROTEIN 1-like [Ctenocephalides felis]